MLIISCLLFSNTPALAENNIQDITSSQLQELVQIRYQIKTINNLNSYWIYYNYIV